MRIVFNKDSPGSALFPGLARSVTIDTDKLPAEEKQRVEALISQANFFDLSSKLPTDARRDIETFQVMVEDASRKHTAQLDASQPAAGLKPLVDYLRDKQNQELNKI